MGNRPATDLEAGVVVLKMMMSWMFAEGRSILGGDADVAAEADDGAEAQLAQEGEQPLVSEFAAGQDRRPAA